MKRTVVSLVILSLALVPANARRFAEGPVRLTVWPVKAPESADKVRLLPKADDLTDADAVPLYEEAVQAMPRGIKQDQIREWLKLPPEQLPQQQAEEMVQNYQDSLRLVVQATKCKQCNWPDWKPGTEIANLNEYRELAFVIQLWARLEISRGGHDGALLAMQAGFAMAKQLGEGPTIMQGLVGIAVAAMMCREVEYFVQAKDAPNLHAALADLPRPLIDVEEAIEKERGNLNNYNILVRKQFEKQLDPAYDRIRLTSKRLTNNLNSLQCVEAIRHHAATHEGQLPEALSDISDVEVPNDLMSGKAFAYRRTADGAEVQSTIPQGGGPEDTIHYAIVVKK
ncbi:MAG TPA: hypothetical protein VMW24_02155 [Sedimentisphaerales bacterium]|nr:hypothetical protein [Sedimentisphaerales bacterium]